MENEIKIDKQSETRPEVGNDKKTLLPDLRLPHPWLTFLTIVVAAILLMLLWWRVEDVGLRLPLSVALVGITLMLNSIIQKKKLEKTSILLFLLTQMASLIPTFRSEGVTVAVSVLVTAVLLFLLLVDFLNGQWWQFRIREYILPLIMSFAAFFVGLPTFLKLGLQSSKVNTPPGQGKKLALGVLKGVLIAFPVLIIFILLFSSADLIFENKLSNFFDWLRNDSIDEIFSRLLLTFFFTVVASAGLWLTFSFGRKKLAIEPDKALWKPFLGMTETTIVLVSVNLLFAFFLAIQFRYFFAGEANINAAGFTYAEYARKGFQELLIVASLAGMLYYLLAACTRRDSPKKRLAFSILGGLLLAQVMVVLVSAYQRITLYTGQYGMTEIRLVPKIFIFFLAAILVSLVLMEWKGLFKSLALVLLTASFLFAVSLALVNIDRTIARINVERALEGDSLDYGLLATRLSNDAVPYLYEVLDSGLLPQEVESNLSKVMVCKAYKLSRSSEKGIGLSWNYYWIKANEQHQAHSYLMDEYSLVPVGDYRQGFLIDDMAIPCD